MWIYIQLCVCYILVHNARTVMYNPLLLVLCLQIASVRCDIDWLRLYRVLTVLSMGGWGGRGRGGEGKGGGRGMIVVT